MPSDPSSASCDFVASLQPGAGDARRLEDLAAAVADARPVDWGGTLGDPIAANLRALQTLAAPVGRRPASPAAALRLPGWARALLWMAAIRVGIASVGYLLGDPRLRFGDVPAWLLLLHAVLFGASAAVLLNGGARDRRAAWLGGLYLLVASAFSDRQLAALLEAAPAVWQPAVRMILVVRVDAFLLGFLWMFAVEFPMVPPWGTAQRLARHGARVAVALSALLLAGDVLTTLAPSFAAATGAWIFDSRASARSYCWALAFPAGLPVLPLLIWKARVAERDERRRVALFAWGLVAGLAPIVAIVTAAQLSPAAWAFREAHLTLVRVVVYASLLSIPFTTAYAVLVRRVLDVRLIVRRTVQHALARFTLRVAVSAPIAGLVWYLFDHRLEPIGELVSRPVPVTLAAAVAVTVALGGIRDRALDAIDLVFFRERHASGPVLARFAHRVRTALTVRAASEVLEEEIGRALHPVALRVLLKLPGTAGLSSGAPDSRPLGGESAIAAMLAPSPEPLVIETEGGPTLASLLPAEDARWLADAEAAVMLPLQTAAGDLFGCVVLGPKRSELRYSPRDLDLLKALTTAAAAAIEHRLSPASDSATSPDSADVASECAACGRVRPATGGDCPCGGPRVDAALPDTVLGKFALERRLGAGGMGVVYAASDTTLGRRVAIKTLPALSPEGVRRMRLEARAMARVMHPNLAQIYETGTWRGVPLLVVEHLAGGTLADRLRHGRLSEDETVGLGLALADALACLHDGDLLHRDVKPSNIGFAADRTPKLLDFGLARMVGLAEQPGVREAGTGGGRVFDSGPTVVDLIETQHVIGTPAYLPPEALSGAPPGPTFDLWGLALVLYEAVAGRNPMAAPTVEATLDNVRRGIVPPLRAVRPGCHPALDDWFASALSADPGERPADAQTVERSLARVRAELAGAA